MMIPTVPIRALLLCVKTGGAAVPFVFVFVVNDMSILAAEKPCGTPPEQMRQWVLKPADEKTTKKKEVKVPRMKSWVMLSRDHTIVMAADTARDASDSSARSLLSFGLEETTDLQATTSSSSSHFDDNNEKLITAAAAAVVVVSRSKYHSP